MTMKAALTGLTELQGEKKDGKEDMKLERKLLTEGSGEEARESGVDMIKIYWIHVRTFQRRSCEMFSDNLLSI